MSGLERLKKHLKPGQVYRRIDLKLWSKAVDRQLKQLVVDGALQKMSQGVYYRPAKVSFGEVPPKDEELVRVFLKSDDFLMTSPNLYNSLGVGTTQLYNKRVVYNHKRHGKLMLGGKVFDFRLKHKFPRQVTKEFLFVDLLNNLKELAEDRPAVLECIKEKTLAIHSQRMKRAVNSYAGERAKKIFNNWLVQE
ncbi:MAG: hypothetical protein KKD05_03460 [Candidatus Omnitrophica bacterium]|nr:hypothetical protein [Candidatus Omnitrophota bacterium]